jgi:hypothetical protein
MKAATIKIADISEKDKERFWSMIEIKSQDECWTWKKGATPYPKFKVQNICIGAHRLALGMKVGEIPCGLMTLHSCDNPRCCNPSHLRFGTVSDNSHDMVVRGRSSSGDRHFTRSKPHLMSKGIKHSQIMSNGVAARGEKHSQSKLKESDIRIIRQMSRNGELGYKIAQSFGVEKATIYAVLKGRTWSFVHD